MTGETNQRTATGCPRWVKIALIGSLALNLIVIGMFAGHAIRDTRDGASANRQVEWIIRLMPEKRRDFAKAEFEPLREVLALEQRKRLQHLAEIVDAIRSDPFVPETLSAVLETRRLASIKRREIVQEQLVTTLNEFTASERLEFANNIDDQIRKLQKLRAEQRASN